MTDPSDRPAPDIAAPARAAAGPPAAAPGIGRRNVLKAFGAGAFAVGAGGLLEACSTGIKGASSGSGSGSGGTKAITIGWIHPLTGSLAGFGAPDNWVISKILETTPYKNGFKIGGKTYPVTIKSYDTQSSVDPGRRPGQDGHPERQRGPAARVLHAGDRQRGSQPGRDRSAPR